MTTHPERKAFLDAIRARPEDDTLRLVYADWLDDRGAGDRDAATAAFIRVSCADRPRREMPRAAYPWLLGADGANWRRLLPSVLAIDVPHPGRPEPIGVRTGRRVECALWLPDAPGGRGARRYAAEFEFHRGFLRTATFQSAHAASLVLEALHDDQPLVDLVIAGLRRGQARPLVARLAEVMGTARA